MCRGFPAVPEEAGVLRARRRAVAQVSDDLPQGGEQWIREADGIHQEICGGPRSGKPSDSDEQLRSKWEHNQGKYRGEG